MATRDIKPLCAQFQEHRQAIWEPCPVPQQVLAGIRGGIVLTHAGWLASLIPEECGGGGLGVNEASVILEEINHAGVNSGACHAQMYVLVTLLRHVLAIASGELRLQSFAVTEPTTGTDTTKTGTFTTRKGDGYMVNDQEILISRIQPSDPVLLLERTTPLPEVKKKSEGLSVFLVDLRRGEQRGLTVRPIRNMVNHETYEVLIANFAGPAQNLIGEEDKGFRYIFDGINAERILIAAECVGDGHWFIDKARNYANEEIVFGRPIGKNQGIQFSMARAHTQIRGADLMRFEAARMFDGGEPCVLEPRSPRCWRTPLGKPPTFACKPSQASASLANTMSNESSGRLRLYQVAPVSTNLILSFIGEHVLGMPRSFSPAINLSMHEN